MLGIPFNSHRYFLEPVSGVQHLKFTLISRFLSFISQIEKSQKILPRVLLQTIRRDCRSVTGSNLRNILLLTSKDDISDISHSDIREMQYKPAPDHEVWRINMLKELIDVKWGDLAIQHLEDTEINEIIDELCVT